MGQQFRVITFGCKVNQYEGELVRQRLSALGWTEAREHAPFDLGVVNTCTVTDRSERKSRQMIRSLTRHHPEASILVTGCYAVSDPETLSRLPGVAAVIPDKSDLLHHLDRLAGKDNGMVLPSPALSAHTSRTRAILKVQDGCNAHCAYCIIPHVRPRPGSKPMEVVLAEARALAAAGHRELVVTGIHVGLYGVDLGPEHSLGELLARLGDVDSIWRIRLSSVELLEIPDRLIELMRESDRFCPHLHVPLQSGDDEVLARMNRRYTGAQFLARASQLLDAVPVMSLTTDVIVGFPGETEAAFRHTMEVARRLSFSKIHVFPFSPRRGTSAATMSGQVDPETVRRRRDLMLTLSDELGLGFRQGFLNKTVEVLVESTGNVCGAPLDGLTPHYVRVRLSGGSIRSGERVRALVRSVDAHVMVGEAIADETA